LLSFCLSFVQKIEKSELITGILNRSLGESLVQVIKYYLEKRGPIPNGLTEYLILQHNEQYSFMNTC